MKKGIVVSDIHCGSMYGILPPDFVTFEGVPKLQNPGQEYLWKCWLDFVNRVEHFEPDFVIVNGDAVDGPQKKSEGAELSLASPKDQKDAAIKTLRVLRSVSRKAKWFFTQGTPYHVGNYGASEEDIAEAMDATPYASLGTGKLCRETLRLPVGDVLVEAAHHVSFSSTYKSTPLEKETQAHWMASATHGIVLPDIQIRSHVHHYRKLETSTGLILTSPCWQLQTRYARKNSTVRLLPDIGGVFLKIHGKLKGEPWYEVHAERYKLPPMPIADPL
jgi:hypothetical protein